MLLLTQVEDELVLRAKSEKNELFFMAKEARERENMDGLIRSGAELGTVDCNWRRVRRLPRNLALGVIHKSSQGPPSSLLKVRECYPEKHPQSVKIPRSQGPFLPRSGSASAPIGTPGYP